MARRGACAAAQTQPRTDLAARHFHRSIDTAWRRTSYSGLIRAAESTPVSSEPEVVELDDEVAEIPLTTSAGRRGRAVADGGSADGREVRHAGARGVGDGRPVRRRSGRRARRRRSASTRCGGRSTCPPPTWRRRWCRCTTRPWARWPTALTLRQIGLQDRMREMDFEFPLAGGDLRAAAPEIRLSHVGELLRAHLPQGRPAGVVCRPADRCRSGQPAAEGVSVGFGRRGAADRRPLCSRRLQDELARRPGGAADGRRLCAAAAGRGDAAFRLSAAGAAVQRCAAPVSAVAAARLRARDSISAA